MNHRYSWLTGLLLAAGPALGQASAGAPRLTQTIALGAHSTLASAIALPNHNTVLLLTSSESPEMLAQCLAPDGSTRWKTVLTRVQHANTASRYLLFDTRDLAIGQKARDKKQLAKEATAAGLYPTNVFTDGNDVVLAERVDADVAKQSGKEGSPKLVEDQVFVQRLDADGQLTRHLFDPAPQPKERRVWALPLGGYADAAGYVEVVREQDTRDKTNTTFYLQHYDLATHALRREPLVLPATPDKGKGRALRNWYQDWAYLGHRPGATYFCRRTVPAGAGDLPTEPPVSYQVAVFDDHGAAATPAVFTTNLNLPAGTKVSYSGAPSSFGELNHLPSYFEEVQGRSYVKRDEWDATSGGFGSFWLDHATGDVLVYGEYAAGSGLHSTFELAGFFLRRYAPDGRVLAESLTPYTEAIRAFKRRASFQGYPDRLTFFCADPLTGQYQFSATTLPSFGNRETYDFFFGPDLRLLRYDHPADKSQGDPVYTYLTFAQPFELTTTFGGSDNRRAYEHAAPTDLPAYAALEKLRRAGPAEASYYKFYVSATGPGTGLAIERAEGIGGSLRVYAF